MYYQKDTIAAISTPPGTGGIAVLRVSGASAIEMVDTIFQSKIKLIEAESHKALLGKIILPHECKENNDSFPNTDSRNNFVDEVVLTVFKSPKSYTKEDVVEIGCHGSMLLSRKIIEQLIQQGARLAEPGEFTLRAFLNGRMDLTQAEAVADIIRAKTDLSLKAAMYQFQGDLSQRVQKLRQKLIDLCSIIELELDFSDEDIEFTEKGELKRKIIVIVKEIECFIKSYRRGKILREGAKLVIIGKPNVGKSSLLNALLNEERAIVTDIPGTTRDVLEEQLNLNGAFFRVVDSAGFQNTQEIIEQEGVARTLIQIKQADIILFVFDASQKLDNLDSDLIEQVFSIKKELWNGRNAFIAALNKIDLEPKITPIDIKKKVGEYPVLEISAKYKSGLKELEESIVQLSFGESSIESDEPLITNMRQKLRLERAVDSLNLALDSLKKGLSAEFIALDIREALKCLGEIIGEVTTEDILGNIFSKFCIGK